MCLKKKKIVYNNKLVNTYKHFSLGF